MVSKENKSICVFEVGDLVRLTEDFHFELGCGLVTDIKMNFEDIYDIDYLRNRIEAFRSISTERNDDFFPSKPQILVLWTANKIKNSSSSIWMYESELILVHKVVKKVT